MTTKRNTTTPETDVEERFLMQALQRLRTQEQRYIFTLMADLISQGMAAHDSGRKRAEKA